MKPPGTHVRLIIAGPRDYSPVTVDHDVAAGATAWLAGSEHKRVVVVSGHSGVVDLAGEKWGARNASGIVLFSADWERFGKSAGPRRNREMAAYAAERPGGGLLALRDGRHTRGTDSMVAEARRAGLRVLEYRRSP